MTCRMTPGGPDLEHIVDLELVNNFAGYCPKVPLQILETMKVILDRVIEDKYLQAQVYLLESFKAEGGLKL
jgi:hypothetical protein